MSETLKKSKQRDAIVSFLQTRKDHPTADSIYFNLRETLPNISLGTVYRNLSLLSDRGDILKLSCDGKVDRYDAFTHPHYHFLCTQCGHVSDIELDLTQEITYMAAKYCSGKITGHSITFTGTCTNCLNSNDSIECN